MDDQQERVRRQFGAHARAYAGSPVHAQGSSLAQLIELTQPRPTWSMLDVATGAGHTALAFAPRVAHVVATDMTPEMLDAARQLAAERGVANVEFRQADAQALPFDDNAFDLVTNRFALHHYSDARKAIQETARVCKHGGLVALVDNVVPPDRQIAGAINHFEKMRDPSHNWAYPIVRLEAYFAEAQLRVERNLTFKKEVEFDGWADRMGATPETKARLRQWLDQAAEGVRAFLTPRIDGDKLYFMMTEAIIVGRKG